MVEQEIYVALVEREMLGARELVVHIVAQADQPGAFEIQSADPAEWPHSALGSASVPGITFFDVESSFD
jgi:hypothetical protein